MSSKQDFLEAKAENFKKYLYQFEPSDKVRDYVAGFSRDQLIPTIATKIVPLVTMNMTETGVDALFQELTVPDDKVVEVKAKILAYINMFATVLLEK